MVTAHLSVRPRRHRLILTGIAAVLAAWGGCLSEPDVSSSSTIGSPGAVGSSSSGGNGGSVASAGSTAAPGVGSGGAGGAGGAAGQGGSAGGAGGKPEYERVPIAPSKVGHTGHAANLLNDGRILVTGGTIWVGPGKYDYLADAEVYDPVLDSWQVVTSMPYKRTFHTAITIPDGRVIVAGDCRQPVMYDAVLDQWTTLQQLDAYGAAPTPNLTILPSGRVLFASPDCQGGAFSEIFDPISSSWMMTGAMNSDHLLHQAIALPSGRILVAGGQGPQPGEGVIGEIYDEASDAWTLSAPLPSPDSQQLGVVLDDGRILFAGGTSAVAGLLYDEPTNSWTTTQAKFIGLSNASALARLPLNRAIAVGGIILQGETAVFSGDTDTWTAGPSMPDGPRFEHTATAMPNGEVIVIGGKTCNCEPWTPLLTGWRLRPL